MSKQHGNFVWYELMTLDPDAARDFYGALLDWKFGDAAPDPTGYRMITAGGEFIGGMLQLSEEMCSHGARPVWLGYVGVDDVDATLSTLGELGGKVLKPAWDIEQVGRVALVADPQGLPFYVISSLAGNDASKAFSPSAPGHCAWNELTTPDQAAALRFYGGLFGWENRESMPMGAMGEYRLLHHGDEMIGALAPQADTSFRGWLFYFRVADIDAAAAMTRERGGRVLHGPVEVPGGDHILIAQDPEGVAFAMTGGRRA